MENYLNEESYYGHNGVYNVGDLVRVNNNEKSVGIIIKITETHALIKFSKTIFGIPKTLKVTIEELYKQIKPFHDIKKFKFK